MLCVQSDDYTRMLASLALVNCQGVSQGEFVQFAEFISHSSVIEFDRHILSFDVDAYDSANIAVKDFFLIVIHGLQHLVAHAKGPTEALNLARAFAVDRSQRIKNLLKPSFQIPRP